MIYAMERMFNDEWIKYATKYQNANPLPHG